MTWPIVGPIWGHKWAQASAYILHSCWSLISFSAWAWRSGVSYMIYDCYYYHCYFLIVSIIVSIIMITHTIIMIIIIMIVFVSLHYISLLLFHTSIIVCISRIIIHVYIYMVYMLLYYCQCRNYRTEVEEYEGTVIYRTLLFYNSVFLGRCEKKSIWIYS